MMEGNIKSPKCRLFHKWEWFPPVKNVHTGVGVCL